MNDMTPDTDTSNVLHMEPRPAPRLRDVLDGLPAHPSIVRPHVAGLPITSAPAVTTDIARLGKAAFEAVVIEVDADRIGFHFQPATEDVERADFITIGPDDRHGPVVMIELLPGAAADQALDTITAAIGDGLTGSLRFTVYPFEVRDGWYITGALYIDAEGQAQS